MTHGKVAIHVRTGEGKHRLPASSPLHQDRDVSADRAALDGSLMLPNERGDFQDVLSAQVPRLTCCKIFLLRTTQFWTLPMLVRAPLAMKRR